MALDALLAYLHYLSIFILFAFLSVEVVLIRLPLDAALVRLIGRMDLWYFGAAMAALVTGLLRLAAGAKGADFYLSSWPIYVKVGLFIVVALVSIPPTLTFIRWRKSVAADPRWQVPAEEQRRMRRLLMIELHLAALIPVFAVVMARGLGR